MKHWQADALRRVERISKELKRKIIEAGDQDWDYLQLSVHAMKTKSEVIKSEGYYKGGTRTTRQSL